MAAKPRVLILTPDFPPAPGGIQLLAHRLAATISRLEVLVIAPGGDAARQFDRSGEVQVHRVRALRNDHRAAVLALNAAAVSVAERFRPDVVLSAHIVASPSASLIKRRFRTPVVQYLHAKEVGTRPQLAEYAVRHADAVIAVSRHTCELGRRAGAREASLHRIPPGVDLPPRQRQERARHPTIITVARLEDRYKGHDMVIRALPLVASQLPDVQWVVIGNGPRRHQLERLAEIYAVRNRIRFLGQATNAERDLELERAHVFTMPSRLPGDGLGGEGFGIVYLEAGWHELPAVAGNAGGAVDAVVDGETGLLVDANDAVAVADALIRLLSDHEYSRQLGARAASRAREFAWPRIAGQVEELLLSLM